LKSKEDMTVPLKKEEVNVSKTPCVKEGVTVKKNPVLESRQSIWGSNIQENQYLLCRVGTYNTVANLFIEKIS
jgi:hypothetical protein